MLKAVRAGGRKTSSAGSVVIARLRDEDGVSLDLVHEPVLLVDATGPVPPKGVLQRLRFTHAFKRGALDF